MRYTTKDCRPPCNPYRRLLYVRLPALILLLFGLCASTNTAHAQRRTLSGTVRDAETSETLPYATVLIKDTQIGTASNADGYFVLVSVDTDSLVLQISYLGYSPAEIPVDLRAQTEPLDVALEPHTDELDEVLILSERYQIMKTAENVSQVTVSPKDLTYLPSIGEVDIFRSLQLMPGVSGTNEGSSGLYVRGGTPDQNLVLLDGMTVYHVDHFFGFFSAFNADAIKDVQLFKGAFPAKYGGRTSSVVSLTGKTGDPNNFRLGLGANLLSGHAVAEIPLNGRGSILLSARRSYTDVLKSPLYDNIFDVFNGTDDQGNMQIGPAGGGSGGPGGSDGRFGERFGNAQVATIQPDFYFYDLNAKVTYRPTNRDIFALSLYNGKDYLDNSRVLSRDLTEQNANLPQRRLGGGLDDVTDWGNLGASTKWSRQWHPRFYSNALLAYSVYFSNHDRRTNTEILELETESIMRSINLSSFEENQVTDFTLGLDNEWQLAQSNKIDFGFRLTQSSADFLFLENDTLTVVDREQEARQISGYLQDTWQILNRLELNLGVRATHYDQNNNMYVEPRLSTSLRLSERLKLKGAYGHFHQFVNRIVNENVTEGSRDFWLLADGDIVDVGRAEHIVVGASYETPSFLFDVELFHKNLEGLSEFSLRYRRDRFRMEAEELFFIGDGYAKGLEVLAQKKTGQHTGWISYTLSKVEHQFDVYNDGNPFPALHDQTHELKIVNSFSVGRWTFAVTWIYATGTPYTAPESQYFIDLLNGAQQSYIHVSEKNSLRLPAYHRLDLAAHFRFDLGQSQADVGLSFFNVYNRTNLWYREFDLSEAPPLITDITYLGFTPNVSVRFDL